ncbi:MAG: cytochrome P450 [Solirubrobacteraceae bacterium]
MSLAGPPPLSSNPLPRLWRDVRTERLARVPYPPGEMNFSVRRTRAMLRDPLSVLLQAYARHGPIFTLRVLHENTVFMLGPAANHYVTVSHAANFSWREGYLGDLHPLLGDGLLTLDGEFHRRSRRIMLPAFQHEQIAGAADLVTGEVEQALERWRVDGEVELYGWTRELALRIAVRALFGLDPQRAHAAAMADSFERALSFYSRDYLLQILRGPGTPFARMRAARRQLDAVIFAEIDRRRRSGERGGDILSLLLDAEAEDGSNLSDDHVRDEVMTLLFAGHDTTTSTVSFMMYELARQPQIARDLLAEQHAVLGGRAPAAADLMGGALPLLDRVLDETLRLYPAAWIGPRRSIDEFEFAGCSVPAGVPVAYCSWASHRLPDVWEEPHAFQPERWLPEARAQLPKGAYVPFGGGSRTCIGMRFGQLEVRAIATLMLARFTPRLRDGYSLRVRQMPTIGPQRGMPLVLDPPSC